MGRKIKDEDSLFYGLEPTLTDEQRKFRDAMFDDTHNVIICEGMSGCGKTTLAVASGKYLVDKKQYDLVDYIFAPCQEKAMGYAPGTVAEKETRYLLPLYDALYAIGEQEPVRCIESDILQAKYERATIRAFSNIFVRGGNLNNHFVVLDECQNWRTLELKRVLSRCFDNCKVLLLGCNSQCDIPLKESGFQKCIDYLSQYDWVKVCHLTKSFRGKLATAIDKL